VIPQPEQNPPQSPTNAPRRIGTPHTRPQGVFARAIALRLINDKVIPLPERKVAAIRASSWVTYPLTLEGMQRDLSFNGWRWVLHCVCGRGVRKLFTPELLCAKCMQLPRDPQQPAVIRDVIAADKARARYQAYLEWRRRKDAERKAALTAGVSSPATE
jgi:hypothetical protein